MIERVGGGLSALLVLIAATAGPAPAGDLVALSEDGTELLRQPVPEGTGWCVLWHHSVKGFEVSDCYENRSGRMVLVRSHLPDFAAGLDHIPGRGRQVSDGQGGYWILDIDEPVPGNGYILRPGRGNVDHRIAVGDRVVSLSEAAPREKVRIELTEEGG
ncbi:DUF1850 domain-containing protein [Silicimonas algicola]|uniref:Uncharacterized protein DUF1850 n=1 Tax=Silicimonas algicola TaxID=1826607 RepID=A0A316G580_9RHOB|nr:DUF1850 domain-containing protein [Silicimonas algicola]PWK55485.1 uncharacterized protein DUF1850 [Silicimonas algicola]